jgi:hypothetical protein
MKLVAPPFAVGREGEAFAFAVEWNVNEADRGFNHS